MMWDYQWRARPPIEELTYVADRTRQEMIERNKRIDELLGEVNVLSGKIANLRAANETDAAALATYDHAIEVLARKGFE
jgi:hypothetical protein